MEAGQFLYMTYCLSLYFRIFNKHSELIEVLHNIGCSTGGRHIAYVVRWSPGHAVINS